MTNSMTGFAAAKGAAATWSWSWDIRSVNGRGLDIRMRVPDWIEGLEPALRPVLQKSVARGNVNLALRVQSEGKEQEIRVNRDGLERALDMIAEIEAVAQDKDVSLTPATPADVLSVRGVVDTGNVEQDTTPLLAALVSELPALLKAFNTMRASEGAALGKILTAQIDSVEALTQTAEALIAARRDQMAENLRANLTRVLENSDGADADRVAQELALIAVKTDITEEIDRLYAHVKAARKLLGENGAVGRKLDFLTQEFNREANTLCSKAQSSELTSIGLDLKAVIDQMREQVQNVE